MRALFVGGPVDGQWQEVCDAPPRVSVPVMRPSTALPSEAGVARIIYYRSSVGYATSKTAIFYLEDGMSVEEAQKAFFIALVDREHDNQKRPGQ